jgi:hypothetical protein
MARSKEQGRCKGNEIVGKRKKKVTIVGEERPDNKKATWIAHEIVGRRAKKRAYEPNLGGSQY